MGDPQEDIDFDLIANEAASEPLNHLEINRETLKRGFWLLNQPAEIISQQSELLSDNEALAIEVVFLESGDIGQLGAREREDDEGDEDGGDEGLSGRARF